MAEAFRALLSKAFLGGLLEDFEVRRNGLRVSHLQFADNTLIMCKTSKTQVKYLRCVIRSFEAISVLKINLYKNKLFGVGTINNIGRLVDCLGCTVGSLPTTFFGLPLGAPYKS